MKFDSRNPNRLIVEGPADLFSVVSLIRAQEGVIWPLAPSEPPVYILPAGGLANILDADKAETYRRSRGLKRLGVIVDADSGPAARQYQSLRAVWTSILPELPEELPPTGLIYENDELTFGCWVMPDNVSEGYLEDFLVGIRPDGQEEVWDHVVAATQEARVRGSSYLTKHESKAIVHAWTAWNNEPDQHLGVAISRGYFDPRHENARPFVNWFRRLYSL